MKRALASDEPPRYSRPPRGSDAFEPAIREQLAGWPLMPATVIAERIGWQRGISVPRDRVRELLALSVFPQRRGAADGRRPLAAAWLSVMKKHVRKPLPRGLGFMDDKLHFAVDLYQGTAEYYDRYWGRDSPMLGGSPGGHPPGGKYS